MAVASRRSRRHPFAAALTALAMVAAWCTFIPGSAQATAAPKPTAPAAPATSRSGGQLDVRTLNSASPELTAAMQAALATIRRQTPTGSVAAIAPRQAVLPSAGSGAAHADIVGGSGASVGQFPSFAAVSILDNSSTSYLCGGSVVASDWVLSAGHCFEGTITAVRAYTGWTGGGGSWSSYFASFSQNIAVDQVVTNGFDPNTMTNDYALLHLSTATSAPAMPLVQDTQDALWAPGQNLTVVGAGDTSDGGSPAYSLRYVAVPRQTDATCGSGGSYGSSFIASAMFCAGPMGGGQDSCQGDSGGPIMAQNGPAWLQVGVVSWGQGCAQANLPGIYTRLLSYAGSIRNVIAPIPTVAVNFGAPGDIPLPAKWNGGTTAARGLFRPSSGRWFVYGQNPAGIAFGGPGDTPVPGDYNGDATTDRGIFRAATGTWYLDPVAPGGIPFGSPGDIPMAGDLDANGTADLVVFRPSTGMWYARNPDGTSYQEFRYGQPGDIALLRSWTGTGAQATIYRPSTGTWYVRGVADAGVGFGAPGDVPLGANFAGTANAEISVYRPSGSRFYVAGVLPGGGVYGVTGDQPVPADYDGSGTDQAAVFRAANGMWYSVGVGYLG